MKKYIFIYEKVVVKVLHVLEYIYIYIFIYIWNMYVCI